MDVLLCGLAFTSRTETLEDYLKPRVKSLAVIAVSSCFLKENLSSCRYYEQGELKRQWRIPNFLLKDYRAFRQPLVMLVFIVNWLSIGFTVLKLRKRFDLCIGVSHSFALAGAILKKVRAVKKLIYYCIDYYIPQGKFSFNDLFLRVISIVDKFTLKNADFVWDISPNIAQYRRKLAGISIGGCRNRVVPLGYSRNLRRFKRIDEIDRWAIGFVGTITAGQGLQLLIEALPEILRQLPQVRLKIIGQGPYSGELKAMVNQRGLVGAVDFLGFIQDEARMLDLLSSCAIGVALWGDESDDRNIVCADPGKTKLYAFLGMPMLVTNACPLSQEIARYKAGEVIAYDKPGLISAIERILGDEQALEEYKNNSFRMGEEYVADGIFSSALESAMEKRF